MKWLSEGCWQRCKCCLVCFCSCQGVERRPKHTLTDRRDEIALKHRPDLISHFRLFKSDQRSVRRWLLTLTSNLTDLKCIVWENAMETWSHDFHWFSWLGEMKSTPETGQDVLWAPGRRSPLGAHLGLVYLLNLAHHEREFPIRVRNVDCVKITKEGNAKRERRCVKLHKWGFVLFFKIAKKKVF